MKLKFEYKKVWIMFFFITSMPFLSYTQNIEINSSFQSTAEVIKDPISNIRMGGYFR